MSRHRRPTRPDARPGLRNVATAAAAASGVLAVVTPIAGMDAGAEAAPESTGAFRLAAADASAATTAAGRGPVLAGADDVVRTSGLLAAASRAGDERDRVTREAAQRQAPAPAPAPAPAAKRAAPSAGSCDLDTGGLGDVQSWVSDAAQFLGCAFGQPEMLGVGSRGGASDHPDGKALDLMTSDRSRGDAIAECALANADELGVTYVIWQQRMNTGSGWEAMEDRGGATANHMDHVHISFDDSAGSGTPDLGRCAA